MAEPEQIVTAIEDFFAADARLSGRRALVTSGPTYEPVDPVRYLANRSSGRQGHAIASALARLGAATTLVTGPTQLADPAGTTVVHIETAEEMLAASQAALPVDVAVCAAAVSDWRVAAVSEQKLKKNGGAPPRLDLATNPDILASLAGAGNTRPRLVIGFAAETENLVAQAQAKLERKGCDWILANDVGAGTDTFGGAENQIHLIEAAGVSAWPRMTKEAVAERLALRIADHLAEGDAP
jgi:phosphopantothenoylcysteine decarboxylase/phosphopantothenate--cysteine ligase